MFVSHCLFLVFWNVKKYLDEAEDDKKRYIEELKIYQQSEQYQAFMKRQSAKKLKNIVGKTIFYCLSIYLFLLGYIYCPTYINLHVVTIGTTLLLQPVKSNETNSNKSY